MGAHDPRASTADLIDFPKERAMSFFTKLPRKLYSKDAFASFGPTSAFDLGTAKALAWMSQLAYETDDKDKIKSILGDWRLRFVDLLFAEVKMGIRVASTHGIVAERDDATIVAFAGTDPVVLANWISDLETKMTADHVATGFQTAARSILPSLKAALAKPAAAGKKLFITGHSLGGAIAHLIAERIADARASAVEAVYTIGCPRVGAKAFADAYNEKLGPRTFRLVHGQDIVPSVAPDGLRFNFVHVGRYLHCDRQKRFAAADLKADCSSNDPGFVPGISKDVAALLRDPLSIVRFELGRVALLSRVMVGRAPPGIRHDCGGIAIELLPPRVRDHMPDRYIGGLS
jgi:triacylglycerol lipase